MTSSYYSIRVPRHQDYPQDREEVDIRATAESAKAKADELRDNLGMHGQNEIIVVAVQETWTDL